MFICIVPFRSSVMLGYNFHFFFFFHFRNVKVMPKMPNAKPPLACVDTIDNFTTNYFFRFRPIFIFVRRLITVFAHFIFCISFPLSSMRHNKNITMYPTSVCIQSILTESDTSKLLIFLRIDRRAGVSGLSLTGIFISFHKLFSQMIFMELNYLQLTREICDEQHNM